MSRANGDAPTAVAEPGRDSAPVPSAAPLKILMAEDNEFSAQLMEQLIARRGHRVRLATNGREALDLLGFRNQKSEVGGQRSRRPVLAALMRGPGQPLERSQH
jgi:hypothetical protein